MERKFGVLLIILGVLLILSMIACWYMAIWNAAYDGKLFATGLLSGLVAIPCFGMGFAMRSPD